jgi:hypothetical protein
MTDNEERAREMLTDAIKRNVCPWEYLRAIGEKPELTDNECHSIAINYPISYYDIRLMFPRA